jgi:hypothetical protein
MDLLDDFRVAVSFEEPPTCYSAASLGDASPSSNNDGGMHGLPVRVAIVAGSIFAISLLVALPASVLRRKREMLLQVQGQEMTHKA